MSEQDRQPGRVRLDKWLWAARFFKTRGLAKAAIEGGKVQLDEQRVKVAREVAVGQILRIRQGRDEKIVVVRQLSDQRRGAPEAQLLYEETPESLARREEQAATRKAMGGLDHPVHRPSRQQRRQIHRLRDFHD